MLTRLAPTACAAMLLITTGCGDTAAPSRSAPSAAASASRAASGRTSPCENGESFTSDRFGQASGGSASPEEAATGYVLTMAPPKAPHDGWVSQDDPGDGEVFVFNEDWRFRTTRLADGSWVVVSGDRCDRE